jgi:hypothetical protein
VDLIVPYPQGISSIILVCYSQKISYIMILHVLSKSLYIYTYRDTGIAEMDPVTGSTYLEDPRVDRHNLNIQNTHSIFPSSWSHALLPSFCRSTQFVWFMMVGYPFISSHPLPSHLKLELLFFLNSLQILCEVVRSVDDVLSAI